MSDILIPTNVPIESMIMDKKVQKLTESGGKEKAATEFEKFLVSYMVKIMRESVPDNGPLSAGKAGNLYQSMLDEEIANSLVKRGAFNISGMILKKGLKF